MNIFFFHKFGVIDEISWNDLLKQLLNLARINTLQTQKGTGWCSDATNLNTREKNEYVAFNAENKKKAANYLEFAVAVHKDCYVSPPSAPLKNHMIF